MTISLDDEYLLFSISKRAKMCFWLTIFAFCVISAIIIVAGGKSSLVASSKCATAGKWISFATVATYLFFLVNDLKATRTRLSKLPLTQQRFLVKYPSLKKPVIGALYLLSVVAMWFMFAVGASGTILLSSLPVSGQQTTVEMLITRPVGHSGSWTNGCSNTVYVEGPLMFSTICRVPEQIRTRLKKGDTIIARGIANSWGMHVSSIQVRP